MPQPIYDAVILQTAADPYCAAVAALSRKHQLPPAVVVDLLRFAIEATPAPAAAVPEPAPVGPMAPEGKRLARGGR